MPSWSGGRRGGEAMTGIPGRVRIVEVGPRDGLQNEREVLPTEAKLAWIAKIADAGFTEIETGSFVRPEAVPQLADSEEIFRMLAPRAGVRYTALVPNMRGMERALLCGVRSIAVFTAASETFNRKNTNASIAQSFERFAPVLERARAEGVRARGYVSTAFYCPYEGRVTAERAVEVIVRLMDMGCEEVSVGDTIGMAVPSDLASLLSRLGDRLDLSRIALHFHDTRGTALANVYAALLAGIAVFDSSAGGLGGCPYAPGATGNLATEDLVYLLHGLGVETGVNLGRLVEATRVVEEALGRPLPSKAYQAIRLAGLPRAEA